MNYWDGIVFSSLLLSLESSKLFVDVLVSVVSLCCCDDVVSLCCCDVVVSLCCCERVVSLCYCDELVINLSLSVGDELEVGSVVEGKVVGGVGDDVIVVLSETYI